MCGLNFYNLGIGQAFLTMVTEVETMKNKIAGFDCIKIQHFCVSTPFMKLTYDKLGKY